jgi:hypothetical protein
LVSTTLRVRFDEEPRGEAARVPTAVRRILPLLVLSAALLGATAASASARATSGSPACGDPMLSRPFLPWADVASYMPQPGGDFESSLAGWTLEGGAGPVAGSERYEVSGPGRRALGLPAGSRATSSAVCVGIEYPTVRFFARQESGWVDASLQVEVLFRDLVGEVRALPIALIAGTGAWAPTAPLPFAANLLAPLGGDHALVAFRFTALGDASWTIDDVFIDPWHSR